MKSFDDWFYSTYNTSLDDFNVFDMKDSFKAGQQSKQDEVDLLQGQVDELQKRIDKLIPLLERYDYSGWIEILKGNK